MWLRSMTQHIQKLCGLSSSKLLQTTTCIAQIKGGYKGNRTKHISPKLFYIYDLEENCDIRVQQICSKDNLVLFTKSLHTATFEKLVHDIGMRGLKDLKMMCS